MKKIDRDNTEDLALRISNVIDGEPLGDIVMTCCMIITAATHKLPAERRRKLAAAVQQFLICDLQPETPPAGSRVN